MKLFILLSFLSVYFVAFASGEEKEPVAVGHLIAQDSEAEWDFRGELSPFLMGSETAKLLPKCETYEELRDTLRVVIAELDGCSI